jgi:hypothetical protein
LASEMRLSAKVRNEVISPLSRASVPYLSYACTLCVRCVLVSQPHEIRFFFEHQLPSAEVLGERPSLRQLVRGSRGSELSSHVRRNMEDVSRPDSMVLDQVPR